MPTTYYFYATVGGFLLGTAVQLLGVPPAVSVLAVVLATGLSAAYLLGFRHVLSVCGIILLLATAAGIARTSFDTQRSRQLPDSVIGTNVQMVGSVADRPTQTDYGQKFTLAIQAVGKRSTQSLSQPVRAVVYASAFPPLSYGDTVRLTGELQRPQRFTQDGRTFPYPQYLARKEIFYTIYKPTITKTGRDAGSTPKRWIADFRARLLSTLQQHIPDPHAALTGGVLLGAEDALGKQIQQNFRRTSLIHIVVLSGFNVMIVATIIGQGLLALGLPLGVATGIATVGIGLFALLVGLTPTVVRASIMAVFALLARVSGRSYAAGRGLAVAAVGMVAVNPHILLYDPSFQLSVIATAGLIWFGDTIADFLSFIPKTLGLREAATATTAAQIAVLPLLLYYTGTLSVVSLPANLLVLPLVPVLMTAGTATIMVGLLSAQAAFIPAAASYGIADYMFTVVDTLAGMPFATVSVPAFSVWLVVIVYVLLIGGYYQSQATSGGNPVPATGKI